MTTITDKLSCRSDNGLALQFGKTKALIAVSSLAEASAKYRKASSQYESEGFEPLQCWVVNFDGVRLARISPNGNIWKPSKTAMNQSGELVYNRTGLVKKLNGMWDIPQCVDSSNLHPDQRVGAI